MGELYEELFCLVCQDNDINAYVNPEKEIDPKLPDLYVNEILSDLKTQA